MKNIDVAIELLRVAGDLSPQQKKYREFFEKKLEKYNVESPSEMDEDQKKKFFNEIDKDWTGENESD